MLFAEPLPTGSALRAAISTGCLAEEAACVARSLGPNEKDSDDNA